MFEQGLITDRIRDLLVDILPEDTEIVNLQLKGRSSKYRTMLRILVDKHTGGITLDECVEINKKLGEELDKRDFFDDRYLLDVSSPGINYPLETVRDFKRNKGRKLKINLYESVKEKKDFEGKLIDVDDNNIFLQLDSGEDFKIAIENINKAKQTVK